MFSLQVYALVYKIPSGEGGIRTLGTELPVRQFSKLLISAAHPPHQRVAKIGMQLLKS